MGKRRFKKVKSVDPFSKNPKKEHEQGMKLNMKQRIPRKFTEMMERKEMYKNASGRSLKRKMRENLDEDVKQEMAEKKKKRKKAEKKPGESQYRYMSRLCNEVDISLKTARGSAQEEPEKKLARDVQSNKKMKVKKRLENMREKRRHKIRERQEEKQEKERWTDRVEFGEVAMRPPSLHSKPRKANDVIMPGKRDLLLKKCFAPSRKSNVSMARAKVLNDERERVIKAYRDLKNNNNK